MRQSWRELQVTQATQSLGREAATRAQLCSPLRTFRLLRAFVGLSDAAVALSPPAPAATLVAASVASLVSSRRCFFDLRFSSRCSRGSDLLVTRSRFEFFGSPLGFFGSRFGGCGCAAPTAAGVCFSCRPTAASEGTHLPIAARSWASKSGFAVGHLREALAVCSTKTHVSYGECRYGSCRWCEAPSQKPWSVAATSILARRKADFDSCWYPPPSCQPGRKTTNERACLPSAAVSSFSM
mmetsp:Transcript_15309/g.33239  ORF Transcript_15309/g.33239 Transcript_15309/m.33239 type:complete len:239 (-) Transcript_15309:306-1022(-)